ncbi:MAG TPA: patatin family protein [Smithella sp.]|nr:patatin family protein [Smithella sp.]HRS97147.1 patatin family protein [Smithella sp.]
MENFRSNKKALVVEGGGMRGVFAAGVLNAFGSAGFDPFDLYLGVSAGACNLASHLAGQNDRNFDIIERYSIDGRFINWKRFLRGGHLMDLDWLWDITIREYRLDLKKIFEKLHRQNKICVIVATSVATGKAVYLEPDEETLEYYLKVSSSLPFFYRRFLEVHSEKMTDGGVADSLPVREAIRRGATEITVIRTRPSRYVKKKTAFSLLYPLIFRNYPLFAEAMKKRPEVYMEAVRLIQRPPAGIRVFEIAPPPHMDIGRITTDIGALKAAYQLGRDDAGRFMDNYPS